MPAGWIRAATTKQIVADGATQAYGFLWWVGTADGDPAYIAVGYGGQIIEVVPRRRLVVVVSTALDVTDPNDHGVDGNLLLYLVDGVIAPAMRT